MVHVRTDASNGPVIASGRVSPTTTRTGDAPETSPVQSAPRRPPRRRQAQAPPPDLSPQQQATIAIILAGALDPMTAIMAANSELRDVRAAMGHAGIDSASARSEAEEQQRAESLEKAVRHAEKMLRNDRMSPFAKKLLGAILTVVGTVAAAFSGGASLVLVAVAVTLLLAAKLVEHLAKEGKIGGKAAMITSLCLKVVAAVLMACCGNASGIAGVAANVAEKAVSIAKTVAMAVQTATQAHEARVQMTNAVHQGRSDRAQGRADEHGVNSEAALEEVEQSVEEMKLLRQRFARLTRRLSAIQQARDEGMSIMTRALA